MLKRDCEGDKLFEDPRCCPSIHCDPKCLADPEVCDPNPGDECKWGYQLGAKVSEIMIEPV